MNDDRDRYDDEDGEPLEFLNREDEEDARDGSAFTDAAEDEDAPGAAPVVKLGRRGGGNRVLAAAAVALVAIVAFVFWPRGGGDMPPSIGEMTSVVTSDSTSPGLTEVRQPRSSDVNLSLEAPAVVPEKPQGGGGTQSDAAKQTARTGTTTQPAPARETPTRTTPTATPPSADGSWAIQVAALSRDNADKLAGKLRAAGHRVELQTVTTPSGVSLTRVRVCWFATQDAARAWAAAHPQDIGKDFLITGR